MTRLLSRADVAAVLTIQDCIVAVEGAFRDYATGRLARPASLGLRAEHGTFHVKAARGDVFAAKINANFPGNPATHGLPTIQGVIVLMDVTRGLPLAILDSTVITTMRTAAATAVAAKYLARTHAATAAVIGCGALGQATLGALCAVRPLRRVSFWDASEAARDRCGRTVTRADDVEIVLAPSLEAALAGADIVATCTSATRPFLEARHARPGLFIAAAGADNPEKSEIAPELMAKVRIVTDLTDQAAAMGDLRHAITAGLLTIGDVHGELGQVIAGRIPGRERRDQVFLFDSTGTALQDLVVASLAHDRAAQQGLGSELAFHP